MHHQLDVFAPETACDIYDIGTTFVIGKLFIDRKIKQIKTSSHTPVHRG